MRTAPNSECHSQNVKHPQRLSKKEPAHQGRNHRVGALQRPDVSHAGSNDDGEQSQYKLSSAAEASQEHPLHLVPLAWRSTGHARREGDRYGDAEGDESRDKAHDPKEGPAHGLQQGSDDEVAGHEHTS